MRQIKNLDLRVLSSNPMLQKFMCNSSTGAMHPGLDCQTGSAYLWNTMTRIMLAFLALLTGLVATGAPAAQRACPLNGMEVGATATPSRGERVEQRQGVTAQSEQPAWAERRSDCGQKPVRKPVYIPSVQLGIDRARE